MNWSVCFSFVRRFIISHVSVGQHISSNFHGRMQRGQRVLQACRGHKCPVSIKRSGRKVIISRGWLTFCKVDNLKVGETCIFELRDPSTLWVHVYSAGWNGEVASLISDYHCRSTTSWPCWYVICKYSKNYFGLLIKTFGDVFIFFFFSELAGTDCFVNGIQEAPKYRKLADKVSELARRFY